VPKDQITDGIGGYTAGCAFTPALDKLYTTNFTSNKVVVYKDNAPNPVPDHSILQVIDTSAPAANSANESVVFAGNGEFYVGHAGFGGNTQMTHYDPTGTTLLSSYDVTVQNTGSDWGDLVGNTMFYTSEGDQIMSFDVTDTNPPTISTFANLPDPSPGFAPFAYALRFLPKPITVNTVGGPQAGVALVADQDDVLLLDAGGNIIKHYDVHVGTPLASGTSSIEESSWFALNLDPDTTDANQANWSFWSGNFASNNFYRFNMQTGAVEVGPINTGGQLFGLCVKGEVTMIINKVEACNVIPPVANTCHPPGTYDSAGYPDHCNDPRSSSLFSESSVLKQFGSANNGQDIVAWYSDEHPLSLGVRQVTGKSVPLGAKLCSAGGPTATVNGVHEPATGDQPLEGCVGDPFVNGVYGNNDPSGRAIRPLLFMTELPDTNSTLRTGDWQMAAGIVPGNGTQDVHNGTGFAPTALYGTWKGGVSAVDFTKPTPLVTFTPDPDTGIHKNAWPVVAGLTPPPKNLNEGYSAAIVWHIASLPVQPGHIYRMQFMVHDGDQNKSGGDVGEGCAKVTFGTQQ
jgi:hypothetical protein